VSWWADADGASKNNDLLVHPCSSRVADIAKRLVEFKLLLLLLRSGDAPWRDNRDEFLLE
jgi:hypothetical protein